MTVKGDSLQRRMGLTGGNLSLAYHEPLNLVKGEMQYVFDQAGRRYLDAYNNVPHVGHCHPEIVEAACQQMRTLNTNTRYLSDVFNDYAEALVATMPVGLNTCFFLNSASEANELALRMSRAYNDRKDVIVTESAYHGNTTSMIDISPYKHSGPGGSGAPDWVHTVPIADPYRGRFRGDNTAHHYAHSVAAKIDELQSKGKQLSAFIAETYPSVGGQIIPPKGYLAAVYKAVRQAGGLCIADEVQTAYGRIGSAFYAFEQQAVVPDVVVLGKPIGNGHPMAALITRRDIAKAFDNGMEFFSTFGGSTLSCAIGSKVLEVTQKEQLQAKALAVGTRLIDGFEALQNKHAMIGDVRGSGLFLGVELVRDLGSLEPASSEASAIVNQLKDAGLLIGTDGPFHNILKIRPPLAFNAANADELIVTLDAILTSSRW